MHLIIFLNGSDHAKYKKKVNLHMEDESECHENKKSYCVVTEIKYVLKNNAINPMALVVGRLLWSGSE